MLSQSLHWWGWEEGEAGKIITKWDHLSKGYLGNETKVNWGRLLEINRTLLRSIVCSEA